MIKILVINHDLEIMDLLKRLLAIRGYQVMFVTQREALQAIRKFRPQILLIDMTADELLDTINEEPDLAAIPLLLMTGYDRGYKNPGINPSAVIEKPFSIDALQAKLNMLIASAKHLPGS